MNSAENPYDPHNLWKGLGPDDPLPYETVREGVTRFLVHTIRWSWDDQTPIKHPYYLARDEGLKAWCRQAARSRLAVQLRPSYTIVQFHELIFSEQMRRGGEEAMAEPVWTPLFEHMQRSHTVEFFTHLHFLFNQKPPVGNMPQWMFCLLWDRSEIPLDFWTYPAASRYLATRMPRNVAPDETLLRQWGRRLGLAQTYPSVVTEFDPKRGIPETGFNAEAFLFHGIPYEPAEVAERHNIG